MDDIKERKKAEEELLWLRLGVARSDEVIFMTDTEGVITCVNPAFEKTYGYAFEEAVGQTPRILKSGKHSPAYYKAFWETILAKEVAMSEMINKSKNGRLLYMAISANPILDKTGTIVGFLAIQQDISKRKRAEVERESLISDLEQKNAEMERFNYTISHDLKSPLITIKGFISILEKELAKEKKHDAALDAMGYIYNAVDKMHLLLEDLLNLSRSGRLVNPPEEFALGTLVDEVLDQLAGPIADGKVTVEIDSDLPTVFADRIGMFQVMQNLIENGVKFTGDEKGPQIKIGTRDEEGEQVIYVRDNGIGIDPQFEERIFDLFQQLKPSPEGSGVGLTLVKRIIELHGGRIWVESEGVGKGAAFCFTLPRQEA